MSEFWPTAVYGLCLLTSALCAWLLWRAWRRSGSRLLLWTAVSFCFFALNNLALVADMVVFPDADLRAWRVASNVLALGLLLYGFIWESEA